MKASVFVLTFILSVCYGFCPIIIKKDLEWDKGVEITPDYPQNKTIFVDSCPDSKVGYFKGWYGKQVWPLRQTDIAANTTNYFWNYNNGGTPEYGYLDAYGVKASDLRLNTKVDGERCRYANECLVGQCTDGVCQGYGDAEPCTTSSQGARNFYGQNNLCTSVKDNGDACTSDDEGDINNICENGSNTCQYAYFENDGTNVRDPRRGKR